MKADARQVFVYYCDVESKKAGAVLPTMTDLVAVWDAYRRAGQASLAISNGEMNIVLGDVVIDPAMQAVTLLFRMSDKTAADVVYSDMRAGTFTTHAKRAGEGGETGVHVWISSAPERGTITRYTCVIEKSTELDRNKIRRLLNTILHREYSVNANSFEYPNPAGQRDRDGNIRTERALPRIEFLGQPSASLVNDLQNGKLTGLTLIEATPRRQIGGKPYLHMAERKVSVDIDHGNLPANIFAGIQQALRFESATYPAANITLRLPGRQKTVSVKVDSATASPLSDLYIKSFDVTGITPLLSHSAIAVVAHFNARGLPILDSERSI